MVCLLTCLLQNFMPKNNREKIPFKSLVSVSLDTPAIRKYWNRQQSTVYPLFWRFPNFDSLVSPVTNGIYSIQQSIFHGGYSIRELYSMEDIPFANYIPCNIFHSWIIFHGIYSITGINSIRMECIPVMDYIPWNIICRMYFMIELCCIEYIL